jgi:hypothetical protein
MISVRTSKQAGGKQKYIGQDSLSADREKFCGKGHHWTCNSSSVVVEREDSSSLIPKSAIGHDPESVSPISGSYNFSLVQLNLIFSPRSLMMNLKVVEGNGCVPV